MKKKIIKKIGGLRPKNSRTRAGIIGPCRAPPLKAGAFHKQVILCAVSHVKVR